MINRILDLFRRKREIGGRSFSSWYYSHIRGLTASEDELLVAISRLKFNEIKELDLEDINNLFFEEEDYFLLCLIIYFFSKKNKFPKGFSKKVIPLLGHKNRKVRYFATNALLRAGETNGLIALIEEQGTHGALMVKAAIQLGLRGENAKEAIPSLIKMMTYKDKNSRTHNTAAEALADIGESAKPILMQYVNSDNKYLADLCIYSIELITKKPFIK
ncbi:MAG: hypothetical protein MK212_14565 [Saprospiraceae bacterium]|nr:hypothetical protein [Saprospiraceae bacterium]